jgi:bacterioferritin-associated ferredoxin
MSNYQTSDREGHGLGYTVPQLEQALYAAVERARVAENRAAEYLQQVNDRDRFIAIDRATIQQRDRKLTELSKLIDCAWSAQCGECLNAAHALLEG